VTCNDSSVVKKCYFFEFNWIFVTLVTSFTEV